MATSFCARTPPRGVAPPAPRARPAQFPRPGPVVARASGKGKGEEPSWEELGKEAADVAKGAAQKLGGDRG